MNPHRNNSALVRAATAAIVGCAMVCGLLILFSQLTTPVAAAPLAATIISSDIVGDATWTPAGSPYIISGTVSVYSGTLVISPRVTVRFRADAELIVQSSARLVAIGTSSQPITFTSNLPAPDSCDWDDIRFNSNGNVVRYSLIEYATWGLDLREPYGEQDISYNTFLQNGLCAITPVGGAVIGSTDVTTITHNTFSNNAAAVRLSKSSSNLIAHNVVSGTTHAAIAFVRALATPSSDNQVFSNTVHASQDAGILLDLGNFNEISNNVVYENRGDGVRAIDQRVATITGNRVYRNARKTSSVAGLEVRGGQDVTVQRNLIYQNGATGSYTAGLYIDNVENVSITDNFIHDNSVQDGLEYGSHNSGALVVTGNAICRNPAYELRNRHAATLAAEGNWWGTNAPAAEISGPVDYNPSIQLGLASSSNSIRADGIASTTLTVTFHDGAGHTVPPPVRGIALATSRGTLSTNSVTVNGSGQASLTLTSSSTPGTAVVTATDRCGYAVTDTVTFAGYVDLNVTKTASPPPYGHGDLITYTISYRNNGNGSAAGVVLTETLPVSTTYAGRPAGWRRVGATTQYTRSVGTLAPGGAMQTTFVVSIADNLPPGVTAFTNVVRIRDNGASGPDFYPADNIFTLTVSGGALPDLWVVKNDNVGPGALSGALVGMLANTEEGPQILEQYRAMDGFSTAAVPEGGLITYTIGYGNSSQGGAPATGVVLSETLPLYTTYAGPTCGQPAGWCQVGATRVYTRYVGGPLTPGMGNYAYFQVRVDSSVPPSVTQVINTVCIDGDQTDLIPANDCSTEETDVVTGTYDLSVTKLENGVCFNPGDALNYQITLRNLGVNDATGVVLRETMPQNTTFIGPSGWTAAGGGVYTQSLGTVPGGAVSSALFSVQINPSLPRSVGTITNVVTIQANGTDADAANNSFTLVTPLGTTPDLAITKNDNITDSVDPGDIITYTVMYVNNSHRYTATRVIITETLPAGTAIFGASASQWHRVGATDLYTHSVGRVAPNATGSLQFVVRVNDPFLNGSEVVNQVAIGGAQSECNTANNVASEETPVRGADATDLVIAKTDQVAFCAVPGDLVEYTIAYTNNSYTIPAQNVVVTESVDASAVTFLRPAGWTPRGGGLYTRTPVTPTVAPRETGSFLFDVEIAASLPSGQEYITNVVRIGTTTQDWILANNEYVLRTYVPEWPDLIVVKNDNVGALNVSAMGRLGGALSRLEFSEQARALLEGGLDGADVRAMDEAVVPGDTITYTIILGNIGRAPSGSVVLTETLPDGTAFVGPGYWQPVGSTNQYVYSVGSLNDGVGDVLQFILQVNDPFLAGSRVINTIQIGGDGQECDTANNISTDETPVTGAGYSNTLHLPIILKNYPRQPSVPTPTPTRPPLPTPTPTPQIPIPGENSHVADVAVDPQSHYVYVASPLDDKVHFIHVSHVNTYTHEAINDIVVGNGPTGLGVFPTDGLNSRFFVAHAFDWENGLRYFYPNPAGFVDPQQGYVGSAPFKVAVNPALERAYVSNYWDYLAVVDADNTTRIGWVKQKNYQGGWGIDVSTDTNRIYLATRDTGELVALDGNGDRLLQEGYIPTHFKPPQACSLYTVAVNENTDHLFVPCPTLRKIFVHEESDLDIFIAQERGKLELRDDGWVRVMAPGDVHWLPPITLDAGVVSAQAGVWGITVDELTNRVFITDPKNDVLIVIQDGDAMSVSYVTSAAAGFDEPQGVDVDSGRGRVFVANAGNDTLTVLSASPPFTKVTTIDVSEP